MLKHKKPPQKLFFDLLLQSSDDEILKYILDNGPKHVRQLIPSLPPWESRQVYKRFLTFARHYREDYKVEIYDKLISLDRVSKQKIEKSIVKSLRRQYPDLGISDHEVLLDVPTGDRALPPIQIVYPSIKDEISLRAITHFSESIFEQFFKFTKKARVFCSPRIAAIISKEKNQVLHTIAALLEVALPDDEIKS
jgi:hypothetical protein